MRFAPVLTDLAGRLAGGLPADPVARAYALRDAAAIVEPDVLVSHLDPGMEARALGAVLDGGADVVDALLDAPGLATLPEPAALVECVRTLAGADRSRPVAATLGGPGTLAAGVAPDAEDPEEAAEICGDLLAAYAGALLDAGATLVVVVERADPPRPVLPGAHAPLVRALALHRAEAVLWADGDEDAGYPGRARSWDGTEPAPPIAVVDPDPAAWGAFAGLADVDLMLTAGPIPADADLERLRGLRATLAG